MFFIYIYVANERRRRFKFVTEIFQLSLSYYRKIVKSNEKTDIFGWFLFAVLKQIECFLLKMFCHCSQIFTQLQT